MLWPRVGAHEQFEVLKSVVAVAAADRIITRSELGLIQALAARVGISRRSLGVLIERARQNQRMHEELGYYDIGDREKAMELLVGAAAIDGEIADEEVEQLSIIARSSASPRSIWSRSSRVAGNGPSGFEPRGATTESSASSSRAAPS